MEFKITGSATFPRDILGTIMLTWQAEVVFTDYNMVKFFDESNMIRKMEGYLVQRFGLWPTGDRKFQHPPWLLTTNARMLRFEHSTMFSDNNESIRSIVIQHPVIFRSFHVVEDVPTLLQFGTINPAYSEGYRLLKELTDYLEVRIIGARDRQNALDEGSRDDSRLSILPEDMIREIAGFSGPSPFVAVPQPRRRQLES